MGDTVQLGQWGGYGGKPWECTGSIRKIVVRHDKAVYSLTFTNIKDGKPENSPRFGGEGGKEETVSLGNDEYLVKITGTVGVLPVYYPDQQLITSLTFVSNNDRRYGPYGDGGGTPFSVPLEGSRIAGLFGRCGEYLDAIGVSVVGCEMEGKVKVGLWGGPGDKSMESDGPIKKITLKYGDVIESISFGSTKFGGNGGGTTRDVLIKEGEYLISIRGTIRDIRGKRVISSLVFVSNKHSYGPFPDARKEGDEHFYCPVQSGKITGFYGKYGDQLNAIGIIMAPLPPTLPNIPLPHKLRGEVLVVGGGGGQPFQWNGPTHSITVKYGDVVHSIKSNGNNNLPEKVGGEGGKASEAIPIKGSDQYVVEVRGTIGPYNVYPTPVVKSLTFITNKKRTYGPYGTDQSGNQFSYSVKNGYILGFHGRHGQYVDAIGINVVSAGLPISPIAPSSSSRSSGSKSMFDGALARLGRGAPKGS